MKKKLLKNDFIDLRAQLYSYEEIAEELDISKPTALKWGKEFEKEIELRMINHVSAEIMGEIIEKEDYIIQAIEKYRRVGKSSDKLRGYRRYSKKTFKRLSNIIKKRLVAITLITDKKNGSIDSVTFAFNKNTTVNFENENYLKKKRVFYEDGMENENEYGL